MVFDAWISPSIQGVLEWIGALWLASAACRAVVWVGLNAFARRNIKARYAKAGNWALVTGAGDGIGREFVLELAARGLNVALIGRTKRKLDDVAAECAARHGVETRTVACDFATATPERYRLLFEELAGLAPAVLVNNVGIIYDFPRALETVDAEVDIGLLKVNCEPMVMMTKFVLPHMKARRCGAIINLSSLSGVTPAPFLTTYSATKAFNHRFSLSLEAEVHRFGIDVMAVTPGFVCSSMTTYLDGDQSRLKIVGATAPVPAGPMVRQVLNKLGWTSSTAGDWRHQIFEDVYASTPTFIFRPIVLGTMTKLSALQFETSPALAASATPGKLL